MKILIYEDAFFEDENASFINRIKRHFPNSRLSIAGTFCKFEEIVEKEPFDVFILDIIGAESDKYEYPNYKHRVPNGYLGIELINRLRLKKYQLQNHNAPILMRTARADETQIRQKCEKFNVVGLYLPGKEDMAIISYLKDYYDHT